MKKCVHHGRRLCWRCFLITASFPVEHVLWERAPVLRALTHALGL